MRVYLDHNSTTDLRPEVRELMLELLDARLGNASSVHESGRRARSVLDEARSRVAGALDVPEEWVVFTSGGTEANNAALFGGLEAAGPGAGLVVGASEHSSVLEPAQLLARGGRGLSLAPVDERGVLRVEETLELAGKAGCALLSTMIANNEVAAVAPMAELARGLAEMGQKRPTWHCDAVQALGRVELDLRGWGVDLASFSAHKVGGPLGVGVLVRSPGAAWTPSVIGGGQEGGLRAGTENPAAVAAAALAIELAVSEREQHVERMRELSAELWRRLSSQVDVELVGPSIDDPARLANTLNLFFPGITGHALVARLDLEGLEASVGSACSSGSLEPSHVLIAMGRPEQEARSCLRLSLGRPTSHRDINTAVDTLVKTYLASRKL